MSGLQEQVLVLTKFRCEDILEWATHNTWFDTTMVRSVYDKLQRNFNLTDKQIAAIKNIHERFVVNDTKNY